MSIIRFNEGDFYIYAVGGDCKYQMSYRWHGKRMVGSFPGRAELRARVVELLAAGLRAPSGLLERIDGYRYPGGCQGA